VNPDEPKLCTTNGRPVDEVRASQTNETGQHDGYEAMLIRFLLEKVGLTLENATHVLQDFRRYRIEDHGSLVGQETH
jgi:hypothetical protein